MQEGGAEAVFAKVVRSGVLPPEEVERLRAEVFAHLDRVQKEGAPYADMVGAALREMAAHLPDSKGVLHSASRVAVQLAARSAEMAAARARELAERMDASDKERAASAGTVASAEAVASADTAASAEAVAVVSEGPAQAAVAAGRARPAVIDGELDESPEVAP